MELLVEYGRAAAAAVAAADCAAAGVARCCVGGVRVATATAAAVGVAAGASGDDLDRGKSTMAASGAYTCKHVCYASASKVTATYFAETDDRKHHYNNNKGRQLYYVVACSILLTRSLRCICHR